MTAATERPALTKRQRQVLDEVSKFIDQHGYCTTVQELCDVFGFSSKNAIYQHLVRLRALGFVTWEPGSSRTLRPVRGDS